MIMPTLLEIAKTEQEQERDYDYFLQVDDHSLPFSTGSLIVVGSRPAMGKTTLLLHFFLLLSENYQEKLLFISGEHSVNHLYSKIKSIVTNTPFELLHLLGDEPIAAYPILSNENCCIESIGHSWDQVKELIVMSEAKFIFLDDIQLFFPQSTSKQQHEVNLHMLKELKNLAVEQQKVIIISSQLRRKLERRNKKIPQITDFKINEPLDEIADIIMMLYRPVYYGFTEDSDGNNIRNQAILSLVKSNYSPLFEMSFEFDKQIPCFNKI